MFKEQFFVKSRVKMHNILGLCLVKTIYMYFGFVARK